MTGSGAKVVIYLRLSVDRAGDKVSIAEMEKDCRDLAQAEGWEVIEPVRIDRNVSGSKKVPTPGLDAAVKDIEQGRAEIFLTWKMDRFTRRGAIRAFELLGKIDAAGGRMVFKHDNIDTSTGGGMMVFAYQAQAAQEEARSLSLRTSRHHAANAEAGVAHRGGSRCYGYDRDANIVPAEAAVIREMRTRFMAGESLRSLARDLNERGVRTTMGNDWGAGTIGQMLRSSKLRGVREHAIMRDGKVVSTEFHDGTWEPILTADEHLTLLEMLNDSRRLSARRSLYRHLLTDALRCGDCGNRMKYSRAMGTGVKRFERYGCVRQPGLKNCGHLSASMASVDRVVTRDLLARITTGVGVERRDSVTDLKTEITGDRAALTDLTRRRFLERSIDEASYAAVKAELEDRIARTVDRLERAEKNTTALPTDPKSLLGWWESADIVARRAVVKRYIETVEVMPAKRRGGNVFDESRVVIHWR